MGKLAGRAAPSRRRLPPPRAVRDRVRLCYGCDAVIVLVLTGLLLLPPLAPEQPEPAAGSPAAGETSAGQLSYSSRPLVSAVDGEIADKEAVEKVLKPWRGDLDGMIERGYVRALVSFSKTGYFLDRSGQKGIAYEALKEFEGWLNRKLGRDVLRLHIVFIPVARDQLIPGLVQGRGDIAAAGLTITAARRQVVDFSLPAYGDAQEVVITGQSITPPRSLPDLAGREIFVQRSSSYHESLNRLNDSLRVAGASPIVIRTIDEDLEDEDILEMVDAGLIPMTVVNKHTADLWARVLDKIRVHDHLAVRTDARIAWAVRRESPRLLEAINEFVPTVRKGTLLGNILYNRYLRSTRYVRSSLTSLDLARIRPTLQLLRENAERFELDWLLVAAQAYQESGLKQELVSSAGAVGVMQVRPSTAADPRVGVSGIEEIGNNIRAGTKYLRVLIDTYFDEPDIDPFNRQIFAVASYNAGPNRIRRLRREARERGLDPNKWFRNVEVIAARRIGRETVQYVSNIYKYFVTLRLLVDRANQRRESKNGNRD